MLHMYLYYPIVDLLLEYMLVSLECLQTYCVFAWLNGIMSIKWSWKKPKDAIKDECYYVYNGKFMNGYNFQNTWLA